MNDIRINLTHAGEVLAVVFLCSFVVVVRWCLNAPLECVHRPIDTSGNSGEKTYCALCGILMDHNDEVPICKPARDAS